LTLASDGDDRVRAAAARHPRSLAVPVVRAARSDVALVRAGAAANPFCPHAILIELAGDLDPQVRSAVAGTACDALAVVAPRLVADDEVVVRMGLAANRAVRGRWLDLLVEDGEIGVRVAAAGNPNLLPPAMTILADDESPLVRRFLARSPLLPTEVREGMALDPDFDVVAAVARWAPDARLLWELMDDIVENESDDDDDDEDDEDDEDEDEDEDDDDGDDDDS
jgi:hypothetical protein